MTQKQFTQAMINTRARFATTPGIEKLEDYVIFNEAQNGRSYYTTIFRDGYHNTFSQEVREFLHNELKEVQK